MLTKAAWLLSFSLLSLTTLQAQRFIGLTTGLNTGKFYDLSKEEFSNSSYPWRPGISTAFYFEENLLPGVSYILELQYKFQKAEMKKDFEYNQFSSHTNLDFDLQIINASPFCAFKLVERNTWHLSMLLGLNFNCLLTAGAEGEIISYNYIPTGPGSDSVMVKNYSTFELNRFGLGAEGGLVLGLRVSPYSDLIFQLRYLTSFTHISPENNTRFMMAGANAGIRTRISGRNPD